nr:MAG TPA: hypothetical protein [Caudoviricetes sp.]
MHVAFSDQTWTAIKMPSYRCVYVCVKLAEEVLNWCNNLLHPFKILILVKYFWNNQQCLAALRLPEVV